MPTNRVGKVLPEFLNTDCQTKTLVTDSSPASRPVARIAFDAICRDLEASERCSDMPVPIDVISMMPVFAAAGVLIQRRLIEERSVVVPFVGLTRQIDKGRPSLRHGKSNAGITDQDRAGQTQSKMSKLITGLLSRILQSQRKTDKMALPMSHQPHHKAHAIQSFLVIERAAKKDLSSNRAVVKNLRLAIECRTKRLLLYIAEKLASFGIRRPLLPFTIRPCRNANCFQPSC